MDRLVYRSNKLGEDLTLTNTGGGNTPSRLVGQDPLTGESADVLWVKGSGGDLRTAKRVREPHTHALMNMLATLLLDVRSKTVSRARDLEESAQMDRNIYSAIRRRDVAAASAAICDHLLLAEKAQASAEAEVSTEISQTRIVEI